MLNAVFEEHYNDVIMSAMKSQITGLDIVYSTVYSGPDQRKTKKPRVTGLCEGNSPVTGEFPAQRTSNEQLIEYFLFVTYFAKTVYEDDFEKNKWQTIM